MACLYLLGCGESATAPKIAEIVTGLSSYTLWQKDSVRLNASAFDASGATIAHATLVFSVANPNILSVSPDGLVRSLGPYGATQVSVSSGSITKIVNINVLQMAETFTITPASVTLDQYDSTHVTFAVRDRNGDAMTDWSIHPPNTVYSSDYARVRPADGIVTALGLPGTGTFEFRAIPDVRAVLSVTVRQVPESIGVRPNPVIVGRNRYVDLTVRLFDRRGFEMERGPVSFLSNDQSKAAVDQTGRVTTSVASGSTSVVVGAGGLLRSIPIAVADGLRGAWHQDSDLPTGSPALGLALSTTGSFFVGTFSGAILSGTASAPAPTATTYDGGGFAIRLDPSGTVLYYIRQGILTASDLLTGARRWQSSTSLEPFDIGVAPDGTRLYVAQPGYVVAIDAATGIEISRIQTSRQAAHHFLVHPTRPWVLQTVDEERTFFVVDVAARIVTPGPGGTALKELVFGDSPDNVFAADGEGSIVEFDLLARSVTRSVALGCHPFGIARAAATHEIFATCPLEGAVAIVDDRSMRVVQWIPVGGNPREVVVTADGKFAVISNESGMIHILR